MTVTNTFEHKVGKLEELAMRWGCEKSIVDSKINQYNSIVVPEITYSLDHALIPSTLDDHSKCFY